MQKIAGGLSMYLSIRLTIIVLLVHVVSICPIKATDAPFSGHLERAVVANKALCLALDPDDAAFSIAKNPLFEDIKVFAKMHHEEWKSFLLTAHLTIAHCRTSAGRVNVAQLKDKIKNNTPEVGIKIALLVWSCFQGYAQGLCGDDIDITKVLQVSQINDGVGGLDPVLHITIDLRPIYAATDEEVRRRFGASKDCAAKIILPLVLSYVEYYWFRKTCLTIPWLPEGDFNVPIFTTHLVALCLSATDEAAHSVTFKPFIAPCLERLTVRHVGLTSMPWELPSLNLLDVRGNPSLRMPDCFKNLHAPMLSHGHVFLSREEEAPEFDEDPSVAMGRLDLK